MSVGLCSTDQGNAAPLKEASRNRDGRGVAGKARSFPLCGLRYTWNPGGHGWHRSRFFFCVGRCWRGHLTAKSISYHYFSFGFTKATRGEPQQIQSHQKRRSMLSSSKSQKNRSIEKPYRVGQFLARPPSFNAHALSSCSKN